MTDGSDYLAWRFHMDDSAWARDPKDFLDRGRAMLDGPPLLKERRHLSKESAEQLKRSLQTEGWRKTDPPWGAAAEPWSARKSVRTFTQKAGCHLSRMRTADPVGRTLLGFFLKNAHGNPKSRLRVGDGGGRLASSCLTTHSVPEGAVRIPLLFLCLDAPEAGSGVDGTS